MWLIETNEFVRTGSSFASEHFKMPLATFCRTDRCEASLWWTLIRAIGFSVNDVCRCSLSSFCFSSFFFSFGLWVVFWYFNQSICLSNLSSNIFHIPFVFYMSELFLRLEVYFTATIVIHLFLEPHEHQTCNLYEQKITQYRALMRLVRKIIQR